MVTINRFGYTKTKAQGKRGKKKKFQSFGGNTGFAL
jgi:hypothetical protein